MGIFLSILVSMSTVLATAWGVYNFVPLGAFDLLELRVSREPFFGLATTSIAATDTLRDSRTVINDNFLYLDRYRVANATTSLPLVTTLSNLVTVGTLTSGSLGSGFTTVGVSAGGTGNTTLQSGFLVGNGTSAIFASTSPVFGWLNATSTATASTFNGGVNVNGGSLTVAGGNIAYASSTPWGLLTVEITSGAFQWDTPAFVVGDSGTNTPTLFVSRATTTVSIATSSPPLDENKLLVGGHIKTQGQSYSNVVQLAYAATTTIDCALGNIFRVTMTGSMTVDFKNCYDGMKWILKAKQDGTGGRSISIPATGRYTLTKNLVGTPTTSANAVNHLGGYFDGNVLNIIAATGTPPQ